MTNNKFMECDTCRAKPGAPTLCEGCLHNRAVIERLTTPVVIDELFTAFYQAYPRKVGKPNALKAWKKFKVDAELAVKIMASLDAHKQTKQWRDKQYIPHPATWLNQERWNDEVDTPNAVPSDPDFQGI